MSKKKIECRKDTESTKSNNDNEYVEFCGGKVFITPEFVEKVSKGKK